MNFLARLKRVDFVFLVVALFLPILDIFLPSALKLGDLMRSIFIFAILGLGLNIVTGFTGLLHLGVAAFMAIGAYSYAILTCDIYPFQVGFWWGIGITLILGALAGFMLGAPTLRLRGDYLAIVTLGFGEITTEILKNLETITKGTQGINPLPYPTLGEYTFETGVYQPWYYLLLVLLMLVVVLNRNLESSRLGRAWVAIREDELAATCMGVNPVKSKLLAFAFGAALCSLSGSLWASMLGSTGEPGNYDFSVSVIALCMAIVGGIGSINGILLGALLMIGLDSIVLTKVSGFLAQQGFASSENVYSTPNNWKFLIYGLALVLMMRFKPEGLLSSARVKAELHRKDVNHRKNKPEFAETSEVQL